MSSHVQITGLILRHGDDQHNQERVTICNRIPNKEVNGDGDRQNVQKLHIKTKQNNNGQIRVNMHKRHSMMSDDIHNGLHNCVARQDQRRTMTTTIATNRKYK